MQASAEGYLGDTRSALQGAVQTSIGGREGQAQALEDAAAESRKVIRSAELTLQIDNPKDGQARITSIAQSHGGYVVTSEFKAGTGKTDENVTIVIRVIADKFVDAIDEIRRVGGRVTQEKLSGQDVTEEYIDLEARIRAKRALEAQFLEIMKQARKVEDALEVQRQLTDVRTEIERLEGRRRFLENKSQLATITVTLQTTAPLVATTGSGFGQELKQAFGDGVDTAIDIVLGVIKLVIVLIPVALFVLLPAWVVLRRLARRFAWFAKAEPLAAAPPAGD